MRSFAEPIHRTSLGRGVALLMGALVAMAVIVTLLVWRARSTIGAKAATEASRSSLPFQRE